MALAKTNLNALITDGDWDPDVVLIVLVIVVLYMLGMDWFVVVKKGATFDPSALGTGIASVLGGGGLGYLAKRFGDRHNQGGDTDGTDTNVSQS